MAPIIDTWFVLVLSVAGWLNREQDRALQYVVAENMATCFTVSASADF
jgi:hypothetical protein